VGQNSETLSALVVDGFLTLPSRLGHGRGNGAVPCGCRAVSAWELGSGGCGRHVLYWIDRLTFSVLGLVLAPRAALHAFARGRRGHNFFACDPEDVLRMDIGAARASAGGG
jgi:hypothetical protein